ncbi:MAG: helix-turn-helix transcriptional regulator [Devosia sp.]|uniref:helix-turn-helix domain-containing protein n=1 Tax=Devosia sp. TaxID=1871048 RepID=UPI0019E38078|nr:helix-turn-helix transcriptional regulator [Devosia sp.]MBF0677308.1 helix-turn-helix transcriptional regulator [Devosia sp.]
MSSHQLIGRNLRLLRTARNISQSELAHLAGIDRTYVSRLERVVENPSVSVLDKLSLALGVTTADLFAPVGADLAKLPPLKAGRPRKSRNGPGA